MLLREQQAAQTIALHKLLSAQVAQTGRLEVQVEAIRARELHRWSPRPFELLLRRVTDAFALLLLAVFSWFVARPLVLVWRFVKHMRGVRKTEDTVRLKRRSWRLSTGRDVLDGDPFLASAAKRISFSAVGFED